MKAKSVLITGCSEGGLGSSLALSYHAKGHRVFATARSLSKIQHLKARGLDILELEVTDVNSIRSCVEQVSRVTGGTLDILVNNAGIGNVHIPSRGTDINKTNNRPSLFNAIARCGYRRCKKDIRSQFLRCPLYDPSLRTSAHRSQRPYSERELRGTVHARTMARYLQLQQSFARHAIRKFEAGNGTLWCEGHLCTYFPPIHI
jgi:hypothetical protein